MERDPSRLSPQDPHARHEQTWRNTFFVFSAAMAASGLVDLDAGRVAGALGDFGVAALLFALMTEYPMIRLLIEQGRQHRPEDEVLRDARRLRDAHPWVERVRGFGWTALLMSIAMRMMGVA